LYSPKRRSPGKARPGEFEASEKPRFVGVEADETPADRDVVQLAEDFLERLQLRNHLLVRKSRREELAAIAQALHANAHGMTLGRIFPVRTARLFHELAVRALQRRGAELGEALRCGLGLERDLREARELLRGERAQRFLPRLGALALRTRDELPSGVSGVEALEEHVPVARAAERRRKLAQRVAHALRFLLRQNRAESAQRRAQAAHSHAQLVQGLGIFGGKHAARVALDLLERSAPHGLKNGTGVTDGTRTHNNRNHNPGLYL